MRILLLTMLLCVPFCTQAQDFTCSQGEHTAPEYKAGEVLVKFRDGRTLRKRKAQGKRLTVGLARVDSVLDVLVARDMENLMPLTGARVSRVKRRAYNGQEVRDCDLSRLYRLEYTSGVDACVAARTLARLDDVEFAEPNYIVHAADSETPLVLQPNDPLFAQQQWLSDIHVASAWAQPSIGTRRPVIAILDTGVDISHPDLKDNIWTNAGETENGYDSDRNGYVDDLHGWDFINQTGTMGDYNGHGTHCAGIAAATGNNGIGVVGANPDAFIMPVAVLQSNGQGDVATIIKGIDYAVANGADVISMSFGSYTYSIAQDQALSKAYAKCFLVAAAGNNGRCVNAPGEQCPYCDRPAGISFPGAFTYVLGVMAADGVGFSNFDCNGPIASPYGEEKLYNYEVSAPGVNINSTYPGGRYRRMSGTSMACPMVAGVASRVLQTRDVLSYEILFGDFIHSAQPLGGMIDVQKLYAMSDADRRPTIHLVTVEVTDSLGDQDGRVDAGETIDLYPTVRNDWGNADDVTLSVEFADNEDTTLCEFLTNDVPLGCSLSSYGKARTSTPIRIKMRDNIVDGRVVRLMVRAKCANMSDDYEPEECVFKVENGIELGGTQRENITLYPGVQYIVTRNWGIPKDVVVTVKAGTTIKIKDGVGVSNYGYMLFEGTRDSMITITKEDNDLGSIGSFMNDNANYCDFNYVVFANLRNIDFHGHRYNNCVIHDCTIIDHLAATTGFFSRGGTFKGCAIYNNAVGIGEIVSYYLSHNATFLDTDIHSNSLRDGFGTCARFYHSNYIDNEIKAGTSSPDVRALEASNCFGNYYDAVDGFYSVIFATTEPEIFYLSDAYLGTASDKEAYRSILDSEDGVGWGTVDVKQKRNSAVEEAPACVDYVKVDGKNPLDEADELPPLGVGRHLVEVGFNRVMNQKVHPNVTMGVRPPYTQKSISEEGFWFDPYTYRAYITIDGRSATDGTNRIRVSGYQAKDCNPNFVPHDERSRYNVLVSAAGSMSTGLMAEAGLGKVRLEWETDQEDFADLMGYNIYRFTRNEEGAYSDTVKVNNMTVLAEDTAYTDYDVVPGITYYYYIKEIGTDLVENSVSSTIAVTPLTAQKGDANGSLQVDIADVMTEVAYLSNENPQPFIFEAADVNSDGNVDILDVVGTIRMITAPEVSTESVNEDAVAYCYVEDGQLRVETPVVLGGIQVRLHSDETAMVSASEDLAGMEQLSAQVGEHSCIFLAYSMTGKVVGMGDKALLQIPEGAEVTDVVLSTPRGANVKVVLRDATGVAGVQEAKPKQVHGIYDLCGRRLDALPVHGVVIENGKIVVK